MKKPIKPRKPAEPTKPQKYWNDKISVNFDSRVLEGPIEGLEKRVKKELEKKKKLLPDWHPYFEVTKVEGIDLECVDRYIEADFIFSGKTKNLGYTTELRLYKPKLKKWKQKMPEYEEKLGVYENELLKWEEAEGERLIARLEGEIKKSQKRLADIKKS